MKLHVYIILECAKEDKDERILDVFLQRELAENKRLSYQRKQPNNYYAIVKRTVNGENSKKLVNALGVK